MAGFILGQERRNEQGILRISYYFILKWYYTYDQHFTGVCNPTKKARRSYSAKNKKNICFEIKK